MKTVFLSMPSCSTMFNGKLDTYTKLVIGTLMDKHPDILFVSPMFFFDFVGFMKTLPTFENWKSRCYEMIDRSDELWVLKFRDWELSRGVMSELEYAHDHYIHREIKYIDITTI